MSRLANRASEEAQVQARAARCLNIVEPTLVSEAGHCGLLLRSLHAAAPGLRCIVWAGRGGGALFKDLATIALRRHFSRRLRKLQAYLLYRRLLRGDEPLLVPTAARFDVEAIALAAPGRIAPNRVFLYFHRLAPTPAKERALRRAAVRQPNLVMIGTTEAIEARLRAAGFTATGVILPLPPRDATSAAAAAPRQSFRRVVVAGAARADKGFQHAVEVVRLLGERRRDLPIAIQVSGDHYARHDAVTRAALQRLHVLRYDGLQLLAETLDNQSFRTLFDGAICLQPYTPAAYDDKISAITLDALNAAAPIVTVDGTWMAGIARRFGCGIVARDASPAALIDAIDAVREDYPAYAARAAAASRALAAAGTWQALLARLGSGG